MSIRTYTSIAKQREQIVNDAKEVLNRYAFERLKEELDSLPMAYGRFGAELIYGDNGNLIMFSPIRRTLDPNEEFLEGERQIVKRT